MSLGTFSHGCRSGPRLPCAESNPGASALPSSMLTLLLTVGQRAAIVEVLLWFSLPGAEPAERALHQPLQRSGEHYGEEQQEADERANGPAPAALSHERRNAARGQGTAVKAQQWCREESPRRLGQGTSQLPKCVITPGTKPRGGERQVSFPRPWCHVPASAVLQASREALLAVAELLRWNQLRHLVWTQRM